MYTYYNIHNIYISKLTVASSMVATKHLFVTNKRAFCLSVFGTDSRILSSRASVLTVTCA